MELYYILDKDNGIRAPFNTDFDYETKQIKEGLNSTRPADLNESASVFFTDMDTAIRFAQLWSNNINHTGETFNVVKIVKDRLTGVMKLDSTNVIAMCRFGEVYLLQNSDTD